MRRWFQRCMALLLFLCILAGTSLATQAPSYSAVPNVLRPGKYYDITVEMPNQGIVSLSLLDAQGNLHYTIYDQYPLRAGANTLQWDGIRVDTDSAIAQGEYTLQLICDSGEVLDAAVRIGAPYPRITNVWQSGSLSSEGGTVAVTFNASEAGTVDLQLIRYTDDAVTALPSITVAAGANSLHWRGQVDGVDVPPGEYAILMTLRTANGVTSIPQQVYVEVPSAEDDGTDAELAAAVFTDATPTDAPAGDPTSDPTEPPTEEDEPGGEGGEDEPEPEPTETPAPSLSPPYSTVEDDSYWSMTPGELDDAAIWEVLMQPITVYDDVEAREHAYLMENPDGTGAKVAQLHGKSQGVHVIGEENEHGYILVEAFSNYDRTYFPETDEEKEHAFELKQGYVKASALKTVEVMTDMALVIDKLTQRMYLFIDGERVTEFLISTGTYSKDTDMLFETIVGEFITVSHTGTLVDGNMNSAMAIRINGGILVHEVPHKLNADGSKNYSSFEGYLGTKQSHGCIRVQRKKTPEGYNQQWIWDTFKRGKPYKVIIWDDVNRYDTPTTWQENPTN